MASRDPEGIAAMQRINIVVLKPLFLAVFLGTAWVAFLREWSLWTHVRTTASVGSAACSAGALAI